MPYNPDGTFTLTQQFGTGTTLGQNLGPQLGDCLNDIATSLDAANLAAVISPDLEGSFLQTANNLSELTPTAATARTNISAAGLTQTDFISGIILTPTASDYRIIEKIPYAATLTSFTTKLVSGTMTATLKIGSTPVTGGAINSSSSQVSQNLTAANIMSAGDALVITGSSISTPVALSFTIVFTRTLV